MTTSTAAEHTRMGWLLLGVAVGVVATGGLVLIGAGLLASGPTPDAAPAPALSLAPSTGIDQVYDGDFDYFVGGGVAPFDCNSDGFPDLYFAGGTSPAALYVNHSTPGGDLRFSRLVDPATDLESVTGAYPVDIDSDGITDLVVLRVGENVVLRGLGSCRFERANEAWGIDGGDYWTAAFSATWESGQTLPTMAFGNYLRLTEDGSRDQCEDHQFLRPGGDGYSLTTLSPGWCTLSILFSDWNRTGISDLRATNDRHYYRDGEEQMWHVAADQRPTLYTEDDGWEKMQIWGMGIAMQDVTGDGLPEVFLTSQGDNKLQTLSDGVDRPTYGDIALALGATAHRPFSGDTDQPSTAWHAEFDDVNNDGYMDLLVTKGNVDTQVGFATEDPNNLLLGQSDGSFVEGAEAAGFLDYARSRGAAVVDLDLDGALDVVVVERREPVKVWHSTGLSADGSPLGSWLAVRLRQPAPNVDAVGAWVEVKHDSSVTEREVTIGGGHAGGELGWIHYGLGQSDRAEVRVTWPDGTTTAWLAVDADHFVTVDRATGTTETWSPLRD